MVELTRTTVWAAASGAGLVVLILVLSLLRAHRRQRATSRRLASVTARLEQPGARPRDERDSVGRLEQLASSTVERAGEADAGTSRLAGALGAVGEGVVVCDDAGAVVHRNQLAEELSGTAEAVEELLKCALDGDTASRTLELIGPPWRTVVVEGRPLDDGTRQVGAVAVLRDVSEVRRLDTARRDLLANVAQELGAPVAALGVLAGTIVAEDDAGLTRRLAGRLHQEAVRVGRLLDDIAELSRLEAGPPARREPVAVHLVVAEAAGQGCGSRPPVAVDASAASPSLTVLGDRCQLVSAVRRLVDNAVRASPEGAQVSVMVAAGDGWAEVA
ncbi:MAG: histidine kinase dimerization/phospho-acceptor domain-containing protein, partial [Acidimicrobiales bacterium]